MTTGQKCNVNDSSKVNETNESFITYMTYVKWTLSYILDSINNI